MKEKLKNELIYFFGSIIIALAAFHFLFGLTTIRTENTLDIGVHDVYFTMPKSELLLLFTFLFLFLAYLIKVCFQKFKNGLTLWFYSAFSLVLIVIFPYFLSLAESLSAQPGWTIYPPLSALPSKIETKPNIFNLISPLLYCLYTVITLLGVLGIFKLGKLHNKHHL